ncbi:hypothetical protein FDP41_007500 [Naegleria fowleri]|uniref:EamA domain-containing protein n=1 Tax=Naegleria fowleri TaxID=5763 RepID=A0A6A5C1L2_NAEFO|nr:uncharacterized protein FDP41_007500 [Naegleria fowleri]KAF0984323.1 hypothetical protein FDP41_007500 [Naegleria fowleri]CAG4714747.1 unnamed protein product [Naegleria fowleri]
MVQTNHHSHHSHHREAEEAHSDEGSSHHHPHHEEEEITNKNFKNQTTPYVMKERLNHLLDKLKPALGWISCIMVHVLFGIHPIFSRYLQSQSENKLPSLLLITSCHIAAILIYLPRMIYLLIVHVKDRISKKRIPARAQEEHSNDQSNQNEDLTPIASSGDNLWKRIKEKVRQFLPLTCFCISLVTRSVTNIMSSKFTSAIFVQLFALTTPFILAFVTVFVYNKWFLRGHAKESFGLKAWISMILTVIGGVVIIIGSVVKKSETPQPWYAFFYTYAINWSSFSEHITWWDLLGISMSLISSACLVWYMLCLRYMKQEEKSNIVTVTGENLFILQILVMGFIFLIPSVIVDDWTIWTKLSTKDWIMFFSFTIFVFMLANHLNIFAISTLGSSVVGSILALRLVSTIVFSILILQESLKSIWQLLGCLIVLTSVSYFMYTEYQQEKAKKKQEKMEIKEKSEEPNEIQMNEENHDKNDPLEADTVELIENPHSKKESKTKQQQEEQIDVGETL